MTKPLIDPSAPQRRAANPASSVWVGASAGTGKTKVLTDRVLNLLLAGTAPHRLLCLTFTKAAAAEMSNRIADKLSKWATMPDQDLARELRDLLDRDADDAQMTQARRLFARVLDTPGGMRIETIHAFCQSLLRRFPLEAGLAPHFQVMDDRDAGEMLDQAREEVLLSARANADPTQAGALEIITASVHETNFPDLLAELIRERGRLLRLRDKFGGMDGVIAEIRRRLGLQGREGPEDILLSASRDDAFAAEACRRVMEVMQGGSGEDQKKALAMADWLALPPQGRAEKFDDWRSVFLTDKGEPRKRLCTKKVEDALPSATATLSREAERLVALSDHLRAAVTARATEALLTLGNALLSSYARQKAARSMLDYDDLILTAVRLLEQPGTSAWVLFKLDGGLDHVLIDEAQDTNPDQWAVVRALTGEFFSGQGQREDCLRTVFAVGDAKQSIYSFQRADPREFEHMRKLFATIVPQANGRWEEVDLMTSFRSTAAVLDAVDLVINSNGGRDGVVAPNERVDHLPFRQGAAGLVEVWPPIEPKAADELAAWKPPIERIRGDSPRGRLAKLVAAKIDHMVRGKEMLPSRGRPIGPGDVMVLVRRRNAFVEELVRELKTIGIPVAGADRMVLTEQIAVMDLIALGNALLLPDDDLTLATVLKSPLLGLDEDQLFRLAHNRTTSLWDALRDRRDEPDYQQAFVWFSEWLAHADRMPPHDLYAHVLNKGGKERLLARLGAEAEDPIDEFVSQTIAFERLHPPSLQGFLYWLQEGGVEIKRDLEGGADAVRIMTVHGSKGLQAPIVFLPDTLQIPTTPPKLLWLGDREDELLVWPPRSDDQNEVCRQSRDEARRAREQEYRRLLYVAMTRAEDRLYICGWHTRRGASDLAWYNIIRDALDQRLDPEDDPFLASRTEADSAQVWRLSCPQTVAPTPGKQVQEVSAAEDLPVWAQTPPQPEPSPPRPLAPSRPDGEEPPVRSPFGRDDGARFRRGRLVHRLLQTLPDLPKGERHAATSRFLARSAWGLSRTQQTEIAMEVDRVLNDPVFAPIFGPGSRAEVPVVGLIGERAISGQVDRLLVSDSEVLIVDYKTNRPPPTRQEDVAGIYWRQMAAYRAALACIYPGRHIRCALLWTDGPHLMSLDNARLDDALAGLSPP